MRIMFVGDINLGEYYTSFGHGPASYLEHSDVFKEVRPILSQGDLVVGNLEAPLTTHNYNPTDPESAVLRGNPKHARTLQGAGFRVLQLANNHTVQHGEEGFEETVHALAEAGVEVIGLKQQEVVIIDMAGSRVGFLAASDVPDNTNIEQNKYQGLDEDFVERAKQAVAQVDHLFVCLHWGLEASTSPLPYQRELIQSLSQAGIRGVIGSHPHLFYEAWIENGTVAAPSLGNFVFDLCWDERLLKSGILDISLDESSISAQIWPVELRDNGCLPSPSGEAVEITSVQKLYDLGSDMSGEQKRKLKYFIRNIHKGATYLKIRFFLDKVKSVLLPTPSHRKDNL